jgi:Zn-dependent protease with chaperone function
VVFALLIGLMIYATIHWLRGMKRLWLEADNRAVGLVGREAFLKTLEKMQSFGTAKGPPLRLYPSIPERIRNLSGIGMTSTTNG